MSVAREGDVILLAALALVIIFFGSIFAAFETENIRWLLATVFSGAILWGNAKC